MSEYQLYWGETHHNTYQAGQQNPPLDDICHIARSHLDFYAAAYYPCWSDAFKPGGHVHEHDGKQKVVIEAQKPTAQIDREWRDVCEFTRAANDDGAFVTFPGFEWQGDTTWGDHNVFYHHEGPPFLHEMTLPALYARLRRHQGFAIPHHTAYLRGHRAPRWEHCDTELSPFAEIYSVHGCSETDEGYLPMRNNPYMGPAPMSGSTYQDALDRGLLLGAICSTDNWADMPGHHGHGVMGCWATELTRDGIWEAMDARRVYGTTGDRMELRFSIDDQPMGSVVPNHGRRRIRVDVDCCDPLDRIELLRGNQVIATYNHQGTWQLPRAGQRSRFKLRVEAGWGLPANVIELPPQEWTGSLRIEGGRFLGYTTAWLSPGQTAPTFRGDTATFGFRTRQKDRDKPTQNATILEFEATPEAAMHLKLNAYQRSGTVADWLAGNAAYVDRDTATTILRDQLQVNVNNLPRPGTVFISSPKALIHKLIPESAYIATWHYEDDVPLTTRTPYRIRLQQRNGQMAWSSPIWVE